MSASLILKKKKKCETTLLIPKYYPVSAISPSCFK